MAAPRSRRCAMPTLMMAWVRIALDGLESKTGMNGLGVKENGNESETHNSIMMIA